MFVVVFGAGVVLVGQSYSLGSGAGGASGVCAGSVRADAGGVGVGLDARIS